MEYKLTVMRPTGAKKYLLYKINKLIKSTIETDDSHTFFFLLCFTHSIARGACVVELVKVKDAITFLNLFGHF